MPRSLKIVIICDNCLDEVDTDSEQHPGALALDINGEGKRQLDLCGGCIRIATTENLLRLYDKADAIPEPRATPRRATQSQPSPCPHKDCDHVAGSPQGLGRHTRSVHGLTVEAVRALSAL